MANDYGLPPGPLAAYLGVRDANQHAGLVDTQNAAGQVGILQHLNALQQEQQMRAALSGSGGDLTKVIPAMIQSGNIGGAVKIGQLQKLQQEAKMNEQFSGLLGGTNLSALTADQADALALKASISGHGSSIGFAKLAQEKRAQEESKTAMKAMQSVPAQPAIPQQADELGGGPGRAEIPAKPGITDFLLKSPYVGGAAQSLQRLVDSGAGLTPAQIEAQVNRLTQMHTTQAGMASRQEAGQANKIEIRNMFPPAAKASGSSGTNVVPSAHADLHGDDYLSTLPPGVSSTVKAISEGRVPLTALSTKGGHREAMLERVSQYDPTFESGKASARAATQRDFAAGPAARNVTAINTAIGHMGTLGDLQSALKNGDINIVNKVVNRIKDETGNPAINNAQLAAQAVGEELMRTFRSVGASEREAAAFEAKFSSARSPEAMDGAIKTGADLLRSRIESLDDQYKRGMGSDKGYEKLLAPRSAAVLQKIGVTIPGITSGRRSNDKAGLPDASAIDAELARRKGGGG